MVRRFELIARHIVLRGMAIVCLVPMLSACIGGAVVAGAAGGAAVSADERTMGTMLDDETLEFKASHAIANEPGLEQGVRISVTSYNHVVLLSGQAATELQRKKAVALTRQLAKGRRIYDGIVIGPVLPISERLADAGVTAKIKTALLSSKAAIAVKVKVVTEARTAFLMGLLSRAEGKAAAATVQQVDSVKKVIKLFEYTD